jgi:hypothetical protein
MYPYIRYESAGGMYVGHSVSGCDRLTKDFAKSNPYFVFSEFSEGEKRHKIRELDQWIKAQMLKEDHTNKIMLLLLSPAVLTLYTIGLGWMKLFHQAMLCNVPHFGRRLFLLQSM